MTDQRAARWRPFGTTIFTEITRLAREHGAVNLGQGFPDEDGPAFIKDAAARAMHEHANQYAPMPGLPELSEAVAAWEAGSLGRRADAASEVTITPGCTGALAAAVLGLVNPGDEVILFEPYYDSYRACVAMAGATPRFVRLRPSGPGGSFAFDERELRDAFGPQTRAIIVNSPHNPTGKVFTPGELGVIASLCLEHGVVAISDEVYERLVYEGRHVSIASLPGMAGHTVLCSSFGKTFSLTGWKIGWTVAAPALTAGVRAAHQFLTFAVATPLQRAAAAALASPEGLAWVDALRVRYGENRAWLSRELAGLGFVVHPAPAGYFVMADAGALARRLGVPNDLDLCRRMIADAGVAAIPPSVFYADGVGDGVRARFAFCKRREVLEGAVERLRRWLG